MARIVRHIISAGDEVPVVNIFDKSVFIVVYAVSVDLARVGLKVVSQVGLGRIDPGINHGDDYKRFVVGGMEKALNEDPWPGQKRKLGGRAKARKV